MLLVRIFLLCCYSITCVLLLSASGVNFVRIVFLTLQFNLGKVFCSSSVQENIE